MRKIKIISVILFILAAYYVVGGIAAILITKMEINIMAARALGHDPNVWVRNVSIFGILHIFIGTIILSASIGLFTVKNWARQLWLGVSPILLIAQIIFFASQYNIENMIELSIILAIVFSSWWYLRLEEVKSLFQQAT